MGKWVKDQSGNPNGRPRGSRDKLTESFIRLLADDWQEHGHETLARVRQDESATYCRLVASVVPKNIEMPQDSILDEISRMSSDELRQHTRDLPRKQAMNMTCLDDVREELDDTREFLDLLEAKEQELMGG